MTMVLVVAVVVVVEVAVVTQQMSKMWKRFLLAEPVQEENNKQVLFSASLSPQQSPH